MNPDWLIRISRNRVWNSILNCLKNKDYKKPRKVTFEIAKKTNLELL